MNDETVVDVPRKGDDTPVSTASTDATDKARPPITEEQLLKYIGDEDTARGITELLQNHRLASVYIDARSGGVFFGGEAHISGDVVGRRQSKWSTDRVERSTDVAAGQVWPEDVNKTRSVYVKPALYEQALRVLTDKRLLILWGQAHWGKWTTALHLLSSLSCTNLLEISPETSLKSLLSFEYTAGHGYIIDTASPDIAEGLNVQAVHRLSSALNESKSYLVITVDSRVTLPKASLGENLLTWNVLPDATQSLSRHLSWYLSTPAEHAAALRFAQEDDVRQILAGHLLPGDVDRLAELLASVTSGKLDIAAALARFESRTLAQVEAWFEEHADPESRAFMISLAVLSGARYQSVVAAAESFVDYIAPASEGKEPARSQSFFGSRTQRISNACAHLVQGYEDTEFGRSPVELLLLDNPTFQPAVLYHVWHEYDRLRGVLAQWLSALGSYPSSDVRSRAAAATGELSKYDFNFIKQEVMLPWANHADVRVRAAAAFALGIPAWEGQFAPQVLGLLHHWSSLAGNWRLNWTAVAAYGGLVGMRFPDAALRDLLLIARSEDLRLFAPLNYSIANLFQAGELDPAMYPRVLDALLGWTADQESKIVVLTGLLLFLNIVSTARCRADPDADRWPTILWLAQKDEGCRRPIVALFRKSLNTKTTRQPALQSLKSLLQIVDDDMRLYPGAEAIINDLVRDGAERERERIHFYLQQWAADVGGGLRSAESLLNSASHTL